MAKKKNPYYSPTKEELEARGYRSITVVYPRFSGRRTWNGNGGPRKVGEIYVPNGRMSNREDESDDNPPDGVVLHVDPNWGPMGRYLMVLAPMDLVEMSQEKSTPIHIRMDPYTRMKVQGYWQQAGQVGRPERNARPVARQVFQRAYEMPNPFAAAPAHVDLGAIPQQIQAVPQVDADGDIDLQF